MSQPQDLIQQTFEVVRAQAAAHQKELPDLGTPAKTIIPRRSKAKPWLEAEGEATIPGIAQLHEMVKEEGHSVDKHLYRSTGLDGRRQLKPYTVPALKSLLAAEIKERGWSHNLAVGWVTGHWEDLVGQKIAQHTKVEMVKNQTVFISCDSTAWATNLKYMQKAILQKISEKIGPDVIVALRIFPPKAPSWKKGRLHVAGRGPRDTYG